MKLIPLSLSGKHSGKYFAQVDDSDFDWLNKYRWAILMGSTKIYACRKKNGKVIIMHRFILGLSDNDKTEVDHKDHNGLNNQRSNLRKATHAQNMKNRKAAGISKYLGVYLFVNTKQYVSKKTGHIKYYTYPPLWISSIRVDGKIITLGRFDNEIQAAKAYDEAAKKYHGEFANLNFK